MIKVLSMALVAAMFLALALTACSPGVKEVTYSAAQKAAAVEAAADKARAEEAAKADAKLAAAKEKLGIIGANAARQGGFSSSTNCNVLPMEVHTSQAAKDFPSNVISFYKEACTREVAQMNYERKLAASRAVAKAKAADAKLATAKQKADTKLAAAKKKGAAHVDAAKKG